MSDRTRSTAHTYRPRPLTPRGLVASVLLAASVPAVIWAVSYPLSATLVAVASLLVVTGARALHARLADRSPAVRTAVAGLLSSDGL
ncbi:hypothetical protein ACFR97_00650 [Haloplanus litoreus]|uniref:Uncharacterized protein n=1 Tax=Haloplanus litoreus TaxID=767515 RepID=A0ABD5ZV60_9EURY